MRTALAWVAISALLLVAALTAGFFELGTNIARGADRAARLELAADGALPKPLSRSGRLQVLVDCINLVSMAPEGEQQVEKRERAARACSDFAAEVLRANPQSGAAALLQARLAARDANWPRFNALLRISQQGAATEQWLSSARLGLFTRYAGQLEPESLPARTADIGLLLESPTGLAALAKLYVEDAGLRALLAAEAEKLPSDKQQRFIAALREVLGD